MGAALTQISRGEEKIIAFVSRTLSDAEKNYSVIEKEMLACFWATKCLRSFLWGMNYTLRTDHKLLVNILTTKGSASERTSHRINRWSSRMLEYNFNVEYLQGINVADCLSRLPLQSQPEEYSHDDDECIAQIQAATRGVISQSELTTDTRKDTNIQMAMKYMTSKWPPRNKLSGHLLTLYDVADELSIKDGMLHRGGRIVILGELQSRVIQLAHEGHIGMTLVKIRLREYYWWPAMDRHVEETVRNCQYCTNSDTSYTCHTTPLQPVQLPDKVWQKLALDIMGTFNGPKHKFVIVLVDYYSKWCEVAFETEVTTDKMIQLLHNVFAREGLPEFLVTDNGVQLTKEFLKGIGITHLHASLYHPQTNGIVERMNRTVKEGIQIGKLEGKSPLLATRERQSAYYTTPNTTTGKAPFQLMRGRYARTKLQIIPAENVVDDHEQIAQSAFEAKSIQSVP